MSYSLPSKRAEESEAPSGVREEESGGATCEGNNETVAGDVNQCEQECDAASTTAITDAYNAILTCGKDKGCATACAIQ